MLNARQWGRRAGRHGTVWYGTVRYGTAWYGKAPHAPLAPGGAAPTTLGDMIDLPSPLTEREWTGENTFVFSTRTHSRPHQFCQFPRPVAESPIVYQGKLKRRLPALRHPNSHHAAPLPFPQTQVPPPGASPAGQGLVLGCSDTEKRGDAHGPVTCKRFNLQCLPLRQSKQESR